MRHILYLLIVAVFAAAGADAQVRQILVPTRPAGDNSNAAASTAFVQAAITAAGGIAGNEPANTILAGPTTGSPALPTFRSMVAADLAAPFTNGTRSGNTSAFATVGSPFASGDCVQVDANGNLTTVSAGCNTGGGGGGITALTGDVSASGSGSVTATITAGAVTATKMASGAASTNVGTLGGVLNGNLPNPGMAAGAAAANVGTLSGALTGTLPSPGLANSVVGNSNFANMAAQTIKCNLTTSPAAPTDCTIAQVVAMLNVATISGVINPGDCAKWITAIGVGDAGACGGAGSPSQQSATSSPIFVSSGGTTIVNVNIATGSPTCTLPSYSTRAGASVTFKDVGGHFGSNPLTISAASGQTIDGGASVTLNIPYASVTLVPANDGVNTGWSVQ